MKRRKCHDCGAPVGGPSGVALQFDIQKGAFVEVCDSCEQRRLKAAQEMKPC